MPPLQCSWRVRLDPCLALLGVSSVWCACAARFAICALRLRRHSRGFISWMSPRSTTRSHLALTAYCSDQCVHQHAPCSLRRVACDACARIGKPCVRSILKAASLAPRCPARIQAQQKELLARWTSLEGHVLAQERGVAFTALQPPCSRPSDPP